MTDAPHWVLVYKSPSCLQCTYVCKTLCIYLLSATATAHAHVRSLKCTYSRGDITATHCHWLEQQIPHTLHCSSPACFPGLHCTHFSPSHSLFFRTGVTSASNPAHRLLTHLSTSSCRTLHVMMQSSVCAHSCSSVTSCSKLSRDRGPAVLLKMVARLVRS